MNIESIDNDGLSVKFWLILLVVVAAVFFAMLPKWMRGDEVRQVLETSGYSEVHLKGFVFLPCGDDLFGMGFEAKGPTGRPARGAVCKGIFKGATVRLEAA